MKKLFQKRYYIAFVLSLCLFFIAILSLHSYYNLRYIIEPSSDTWGRTTSLGATDLFKKQPAIIVKDEYADILTANKSNFTNIRIDRSTRAVTQQIINIKDVESYKVQKFDWDVNNIYFLESNSLYYAVKNPNGGYSAKSKIADEIKDFDVVNSQDNVILAAAHNDGVTLYKLTEKGFEEYSTKFSIDKISNIAVVQDDKGIIHVAAYAETSAIDFPVYYMTMKDGNWSLKGSVVEKSISESWSINDIDIGIDDTDAYIFYEMVKWDKFGLSAKVHNTVIPLNKDKVDLKFNRFYIFEEDASNVDSFLNEPKVTKDQNNKIKLTIVKETYDKKYSDGFSGFYVTMDNGKVEDVSRVTKNQRLISNTTVKNSNDDSIFLYLDAAGGFNYEAFYVETGKVYNENAIKATKDDVFLSIMETIPGYVSSLLGSFIKLTLFFPVILWFLAIEFFEIKKLKDRPKTVYAIGVGLYLILKIVTSGTYYTETSMSQMPPILNFAGAQYFYAVAFPAIAVLIQKLMKKHNSELHLITEFIIFALIDIIFTNLLYATYLV